MPWDSARYEQFRDERYAPCPERPVFYPFRRTLFAVRQPA